MPKNIISNIDENNSCTRSLIKGKYELRIDDKDNLVLICKENKYDREGECIWKYDNYLFKNLINGGRHSTVLELKKNKLYILTYNLYNENEEYKSYIYTHYGSGYLDRLELTREGVLELYDNNGKIVWCNA